MKSLWSESGEPVSLGRMIARGGEGCVYVQERVPERVIKLYHKPPSVNTTKKLRALKSFSASVSNVAAVPKGLIFSSPKARSIVGFQMEYVKGLGSIDDLSNPAVRLKKFQEIDYPFLVFVASNLCKALAELHNEKIVVGDLNQTNVIVRNDATVKFLDVDSFQVNADGSCLRCEVGQLLYTHPDLHGKNLASVNREPRHDVFAAAVVVFMLLMLGRHPFAGQPIGRQTWTIEECIQKRFFAYGSNGKLKPLPRTLDFKLVADLSGHLENIFSEKTLPKACGSPKYMAP